MAMSGTSIKSPRNAPAPLFSIRGLLAAFVFANVLCWPLHITGGAFVFADTNGYLNAGSAMWSILGTATGMVEELEIAAPDDAAATDRPGVDVSTQLAANSDGTPRFGRSLVYSPLAYVSVAIGGALALALVQTTLVVFAFFALIDAAALAAPRTLIAGQLLVALGSTLPWHSVYLMPDVLGAVPVIFGAALLGPFAGFGRGQKVVLTLLTALAAGAHYGNLPLTAGICAVVLAVLLFQRRLSRAILLAAAFATLAPPAVNVAASWIVLDRPSTLPLRLPILLARSIEDGPAAWYLKDVCPDAGFAMCEAFGDDVPESIREFLWAKDGVASLSKGEMQRIRDEEAELLIAVFRTYPLQQTYSLASNFARQLTMAGTGQLDPQSGSESGTLGATRDRVLVDPHRLIGLFDRVTPVFTLLATMALAALLVAGQMSPMQRRILAGVILGVLINAAIFGGLSAPVDRYQSRLIWLLPALLAVVVAARVSAVTRAGAESRESRRQVDAS